MESVEQWFRSFYPFVCQTVFRYVRDRSKAEDIAQDIFAELWAKREERIIHTAPKAYLHRMAISRALNFLRDNKKHQWSDIEDSEHTALQHQVVRPEAILKMEEAELKAQIDRTIDALPEKCRIVFQLSRMEHLSYAEIAGQLDISVKTVENQIGKALRLLREAVEDHRGKQDQ